jgi:hypothetical protein
MGNNTNKICVLCGELFLFVFFSLIFLQKYVKIPPHLPDGKRSTAPEGKVLGPAGHAKNHRK